MNVQQRLQQVESRISAACIRSGRTRESVHIIAVTKYVGVDATREVVQQGILDIGENRWQDALPKIKAIGSAATWHYIGHLQTNKVKDVVGEFAYVHSLDRWSLALELNKKAAAIGIRIPCFIQLNVSGEETKFGLAPAELFPFAEQLKALSHIDVIGLMTMAPHELDAENVRPVFRGLRELRDELNARHIFPYEVVHLSMGMSNDFEIAIEEGATWIRLGTVLIGKE